MISERTTEAYDCIAEEFARVNAVMPANLVEYGRRFLSHVGMGARVLDVGCGTGRDLAWLEAQGAQGTGVDLSNGMLAQACQCVHGPLLQADMRSLPFPAGTFDGVWCMAALLHVPKADAPGALAEMRRVLRSDGALHLSLKQGNGEKWERGFAEDAAVERFFARYEQEEARALLEQAGFAIVDSRTNTAGTQCWLQFLATALSADA
jgi:ubiquinone/menaquinone biosynthesis C-methylase UbiE